MEQLLAKAIKIVLTAHYRQKDKSGMPYVGHVMRVMQAGRTIDEKIVGVLHDVVLALSFIVVLLNHFYAGTGGI